MVNQSEPLIEKQTWMKNIKLVKRKSQWVVMSINT